MAGVFSATELAIFQQIADDLHRIADSVEVRLPPRTFIGTPPKHGKTMASETLGGLHMPDPYKHR